MTPARYANILAMSFKARILAKSPERSTQFPPPLIHGPSQHPRWKTTTAEETTRVRAEKNWKRWKLQAKVKRCPSGPIRDPLVEDLIELRDVLFRNTSASTFLRRPRRRGEDDHRPRRVWETKDKTASEPGGEDEE